MLNNFDRQQQEIIRKMTKKHAILYAGSLRIDIEIQIY